MAKVNKGGNSGVAGIKQAGFFRGTPGQFAQQSVLNPQQQNLQNLSVQQLLQALGGLQLPGQGNQDIYQGFQPIENQAREGFNQITVPSLAERFTSLGSGSRLSSPSFIQQLGQAGRGLETDLAALRSQYGQGQKAFQQGNQQANFFNLLRAGLGQSQENFYQPPQQSGIQNLFNSLAGNAGNLAALFL